MVISQAIEAPVQIETAPRRPGASLRNGDTYALGALTLMLALVIANRAIWDGWLSRNDVLTAYMPWYRYLGDRLHDLQIPGWNPYQFSGTPFAGDPNSGWMMFAVMIPFALFGPLTAFKIFVAIELIVAAFSTYALARTIGLRPIAALMGAVIFTFGPFSYQTVYCCSVRSNLSAWLPMTFLGIELAFRARSRGGKLAAIMLGGLGYSQMLAGFLGQGAYDVSILLAFFVLYRGLISPVRPLPFRRRIIPMAIAGGGVALAGVALNAAALLPRLAVSGETNLGSGDYSKVGGYHYGPYGWAQGFVSLIDDNFTNRRDTIPAAGIILALLALALARRKFATPFWFGMTFVVLGLLFPDSLLPDIFGVLPQWRELHDHYVPQITAILMIGPSMLAAVALHQLCDRQARRPVELLVAPIVALGLISIYLGDYFWRAAVAGVLATAIIVLISLRDRFSPRFIRLLPAALIAIAFIQPMGLELVDAATGSSIVPGWAETWNPAQMDRDSPAISMSTTDPGGAGEFLQAEMEANGPFRYFGYGGTGFPRNTDRPGTYPERRSWPQTLAVLVNGRSISLGLYDTQGYNPMQLARYTDFLSEVNGFFEDYHNADVRPFNQSDTALMDMLNVKYIIIDRELPQDRYDITNLTKNAHQVFSNNQVTIYQNDGALPRAWMVHTATKTDEAGAFQTLRSANFNPATEALIERDAPAMAPAPTGASETATVVSYAPEKIELNVHAASAGMAVISEVYEKGWSATVDGKSAEIYAVDGVLRGVAVGAGDHTIVLKYDPLNLRIGVIVSAISLIVMVAAFAWAGWCWLTPRIRPLPATPERRIA